jgi:hypothetical protein
MCLLYVAVEVDAAAPLTLPSVMAQAAAPGYSIYDKWEGEVGLPGEPRMPLRTTLYAHSYFRVSVTEGAVIFRQEQSPPPQIIEANKRLVAQLVSSCGLRIRRWVYTLEGWDDEDRPFVRVLDEGVGQSRIEGALANFNSHWAGPSIDSGE